MKKSLIQTLKPDKTHLKNNERTENYVYMQFYLEAWIVFEYDS